MQELELCLAIVSVTCCLCVRCAGLKKQPNLDVCWPGVLANQSLADQTEIISKVGPEAIGHHGSGPQPSTVLVLQ